MATEPQITALLGALKNDIGIFQRQLEEAWSKVQGETKPIWAGEDNAGLAGWKFVDRKTRLNPSFQLKAYIQTNRDLKIFEKALAEIETLRGVTPINSNQNKGKVYMLVNTMLKFYNTVVSRLADLRDNNYFIQFISRVGAAFSLTTTAKTTINDAHGGETNIGEDPTKLQEIQTYAHNIELKAYATLIRSALDQGIRQLQDRKLKPASWWGAAAAQERERKRAAADTLLTDKTLTGIYALRFIAKQQETNPNQAYITWLIKKIEDLYRTNWDLFELLRGDLFKTKTFKYVYNQLFIIGYRGTAPTAVSVVERTNCSSDADGIIIDEGKPSRASPADETRDITLRSSQYDPIPRAQIPTDPLIQQEFPDALKAAESASKSAAVPDESGTEATADPSTDDIEALIALDQQQGKDVWFFGLNPLKLPEEELPNDWKERPLYRKIADQLNLINYAAQTNQPAAWIPTIFKEINNGCTSDRQIMYSTKCPTFRTYLEELSARVLDMSAFQFSPPETPDSESYGDVTITLTIKLSALTGALEEDADMLSTPEELKPIKEAMKQIKMRLAALLPPVSATPSIDDIRAKMDAILKRIALL